MPPKRRPRDRSSPVIDRQQSAPHGFRIIQSEEAHLYRETADILRHFHRLEALVGAIDALVQQLESGLNVVTQFARRA
jgi:hypothetical protein